MKKSLTALVGIAALALASWGCCFAWPLMAAAVPVRIGPTNHEIGSVIGPETFTGQLKCSSTHEICRSENSAAILVLAAGNKNGGDKNGEDNDKAEKDDDGQSKDKDEGDAGWDRLWDSPMLG